MEGQILAAAKPQPTASQLAREISRILIGMGILPSKRGHALIRDAVLSDMVRFHNGNRNANLYHVLAKLHDCTPQACEGCIRGALKSAHRSGHLMRLNSLLGLAVVDKDFAPPNLEFISLVAQYCYYRFIDVE